MLCVQLEDSSMSETTRITQQEVQPLPRWARLAFAARCLRRALPLVQAPAEQRRVLESAIVRIEQAARTAWADDDLADAAASAYTLALDNVDSRDSSATAENRTIITCMVAHASAFAAEAATLTDARSATHLIAQGLDFAIHAFRVARSPEAEAVITAMRADLTHVAEAVAREEWDDETPVPADLFTPL
jgi:hypothetical protein